MPIMFAVGINSKEPIMVFTLRCVCLHSKMLLPIQAWQNIWSWFMNSDQNSSI